MKTTGIELLDLYAQLDQSGLEAADFALDDQETALLEAVKGAQSLDRTILGPPFSKLTARAFAALVNRVEQKLAVALGSQDEDEDPRALVDELFRRAMGHFMVDATGKGQADLLRAVALAERFEAYDLGIMEVDRALLHDWLPPSVQAQLSAAQMRMQEHRLEIAHFHLTYLRAEYMVWEDAPAQWSSGESLWASLKTHLPPRTVKGAVLFQGSLAAAALAFRDFGACLKAAQAALDRIASEDALLLDATMARVVTRVVELLSWAAHKSGEFRRAQEVIDQLQAMLRKAVAPIPPRLEQFQDWLRSEEAWEMGDQALYDKLASNLKRRLQNMPPRLRATISVSAGKHYLAMGKLPKALQWLKGLLADDAAMEMRPHGEVGHLLLLTCLARLGEWLQLEQGLQEAMTRWGKENAFLAPFASYFAAAVTRKAQPKLELRGLSQGLMAARRDPMLRIHFELLEGLDMINLLSGSKGVAPVKKVLKE